MLLVLPTLLEDNWMSRSVISGSGIQLLTKCGSNRGWGWAGWGIWASRAVVTLHCTEAQGFLQLQSCDTLRSPSATVQQAGPELRGSWAAFFPSGRVQLPKGQKWGKIGHWGAAEEEVAPYLRKNQDQAHWDQARNVFDWGVSSTNDQWNSVKGYNGDCQDSDAVM